VPPDPTPVMVATVAAHPRLPRAIAVIIAAPAARLGPQLLDPTWEPEILGVIVDEREILRSSEQFAPFAHRLRVRAESTEACELVRRVHVLRRLGAVVEVAPAAVGDGTMLLRLASHGVPVAIGPESEPAPEVLRAVTRHFLRSPSQRSPIEPFFLIAAFLGGGRRRLPPLVDFFRTRPGRHVYVTAERRVSLSRPLALAGAFFGDLDDGFAAWRASALWRQAACFHDRVFAAPHECAFCAHWRCCQGCYRLPDPTSETCGGWRAAFDEIRECHGALTATLAARGTAGNAGP